jgi:hypothetical protein
MSKISISKEFGLNPTVETCFICGESIGVALLGTAYKDKDGKVAQAPPQVCCIEVRDGETGDNPYRTGRVIAIKEDAVKRVLKQYDKVNYVEQTAFNKLFPKYEKID